jgi:SMC interacting uncharacterized protein involved in chromosome segregation
MNQEGFERTRDLRKSIHYVENPHEENYGTLTELWGIHEQLGNLLNKSTGSISDLHTKIVEVEQMLGRLESKLQEKGGLLERMTGSHSKKMEQTKSLLDTAHSLRTALQAQIGKEAIDRSSIEAEIERVGQTLTEVEVQWQNRLNS